MKYFLKDKRARVFSPKGGLRNEYGDAFSIYVEANPTELWCYTKQLSQELIYVARQVNAEENRFFVFNPKTNIKPKDVILYRQKWYEVTRTDTTDDYEAEIFAYVKECQGGAIPHEDEIKPYGWKPED